MVALAPLPVIAFPAIDPVLIELEPFAIRWYALAYIASLLLGWRYVSRLARLPGAAMDGREVDEFLVWATLGVVLGGRLGFALFYNSAYYAGDPLALLMIWRGGMSFHGGLLGVTAALVLFAYRRQLNLLGIADLIACATPIGLFLGRLANFVNGELYGRASDAPWAMVFPAGGPAPRHPSQLYEAALEGLALFVLLRWVSRRPALFARRGLLTGAFLAGYGVVRPAGELFREPDAYLGFLFAGVTMGQLLSLPLLIAGAYLIARAKPQAGTAA